MSDRSLDVELAHCRLDIIMLVLVVVEPVISKSSRSIITDSGGLYMRACLLESFQS